MNTDAFFILCGTAGATLWIITLTSYSALLKSLKLTVYRSDLRDIAQQYNFVIVAWYMSTMAIIASCFQLPLFAALLMLAPSISPILVRIVALASVVLGLYAVIAGDFERMTRRFNVGGNVVPLSDRRLHDLKTTLRRTITGPGTFYTWVGRVAIVLGPVIITFAPVDMVRPIVMLGSPILLWLGINLAIIQSAVVAILYSIAEENAIDGRDNRVRP